MAKRSKSKSDAEMIQAIKDVIQCTFPGCVITGITEIYSPFNGWFPSIVGRMATGREVPIDRMETGTPWAMEEERDPLETILRKAKGGYSAEYGIIAEATHISISLDDKYGLPHTHVDFALSEFASCL